LEKLKLLRERRRKRERTRAIFGKDIENGRGGEGGTWEKKFLSAQKKTSDAEARGKSPKREKKGHLREKVISMKGPPSTVRGAHQDRREVGGGKKNIKQSSKKVV